MIVRARLGVLGVLVLSSSGCASVMSALPFVGGSEQERAEGVAQPVARRGFVDTAPFEAALDDGHDRDLAWNPDGLPPGPGPADGEAAPGDDPAPPQREKAAGTAVEPGRPSPLLIYTAEMQLAVLEVDPAQQRLIELAKQLGGFLAYQDAQRVTVRLPAARFDGALDRIAQLGDVLGRHVEALDVTEEFRDLATRLRNAEAVRAQLEKLLQRAEKVKDALLVQAKLGEVTETIERLKGRLRFLEDRIAYSTVTVTFHPRANEHLNQSELVRLPFGWLDSVGLGTLLDLGH